MHIFKYFIFNFSLSFSDSRRPSFHFILNTPLKTKFLWLKFLRKISCEMCFRHFFYKFTKTLKWDVNN